MKKINFIVTIIYIISAFSSFTYSQIFERANIKYLVTWDADEYLDNPIICTISESDSIGYKIRSIIFYKDSINKTNIISIFNEEGTIIAAFPLKDVSSNLMTIWETGSAYRVVIYTYIQGKIIKSLEEGTQSYPELFYENKNSSMLSIVITDSDWRMNKSSGKSEKVPITAKIYKWFDGKFHKSNNIAWENRFILKK
jgi:hypothetical protein